jgi:SAM-dependent methyltransferase
MTDAFAWQGRVGDVWAEEWRRTDRSFVDLSRHLDAAIAAAAPSEGRALDIGSGAGGTSLALAAARPSLAIQGLDLSAGLVAVATQRAAAAGSTNARFALGDAVAPPGGPYHLAFSRHGVMFFDDPVAAFAAIRAAMTPGAPLIFSCFRAAAENGWAVAVAEALGRTVSPPSTAPGPFAFADPDHVAAILAAAGWRDAAPQAIDFTYIAGSGDDPVEDALAFFRRIGPAARALADTPEADRPPMLTELRTMLASRVCSNTVQFPAAAWIWSARA